MVVEPHAVVDPAAVVVVPGHTPVARSGRGRGRGGGGGRPKTGKRGVVSVTSQHEKRAFSGPQVRTPPATLEGTHASCPMQKIAAARTGPALRTTATTLPPADCAVLAACWALQVAGPTLLLGENEPVQGVERMVRLQIGLCDRPWIRGTCPHKHRHAHGHGRSAGVAAGRSCTGAGTGKSQEQPARQVAAHCRSGRALARQAGRQAGNGASITELSRSRRHDGIWHGSGCLLAACEAWRPHEYARALGIRRRKAEGCEGREWIQIWAHTHPSLLLCKWTRTPQPRRALTCARRAPRRWVGTRTALWRRCSSPPPRTSSR